MSKTTKKAFTLIELLVVVAIIALLISILLPSLARAREQAKRSVCLANTTGIVKAVLLYAEDSKGMLPSLALQGDGTNNTAKSATQVAKVGYNRFGGQYNDQLNSESNTRGYYNVLRKKMTTPKLFICPSGSSGLSHNFERKEMAFLDNTYDFNGDSSGSTTELIRFSYSLLNNQVGGGSGSQLGGVRSKNTDDPRKVVVADRNPFCNKIVTGTSGSDPTYGAYMVATYQYDRANDDPMSGLTPGRDNRAVNYINAWGIKNKNANSRNHAKTGQCVARLDTSGKWFNTPLAGADDDPIWVPVSKDGNNIHPVDPTAEMTNDNLGKVKSDALAITDTFLCP